MLVRGKPALGLTLCSDARDSRSSTSRAGMGRAGPAATWALRSPACSPWVSSSPACLPSRAAAATEWSRVRARACAALHNACDLERGWRALGMPVVGPLVCAPGLLTLPTLLDTPAPTPPPARCLRAAPHPACSVLITASSVCAHARSAPAHGPGGDQQPAELVDDQAAAGGRARSAVMQLPRQRGAGARHTRVWLPGQSAVGSGTLQAASRVWQPVGRAAAYAAP
jgi:hypothetical protein